MSMPNADGEGIRFASASFAEAKPLEMPYGTLVRATSFAGFWIRVVAQLIDEAVTYFPGLWLGQGLVTLAVNGAGLSLEENAQQIVFLVAGVLLTIPYEVAFLYFCGWTPGKWAMRIVVRDAKSKGRLTVRQCLLRWFGEIVSLIPLGFGFIMVGRDPEKRGWHDLIAGTVCYRYRAFGLVGGTPGGVRGINR